MNASLNYLTIEQAEALAGKRLDHRRKYFLWDVADTGKEVVCYDAKFLRHCSGCFVSGECGTVLFSGGYDHKRKMEIGAGCRECGYTGVRRDSCPVPAGLGLEAIL